jgi:hypothetical protein
VSISNSVTSIGDFVFFNCTKLPSVTIPNSVTSIGDCAFQHCHSLTSVTIPNSVTSIGVATFAFCGSLSSVTIPNSVASIGNYAFSQTGLTSIYANSSTPVNLSSSDGVFLYINKANCTLYVPIGSKSLYAVADQWKDFINIVEHTVTGITTVPASKLNIKVMGRMMEIGLPEASARVQVLDISGRQLYNGTPSGNTLYVSLPQAGIYLVRAGNKVVKVVAP